MFSAQTGWRLPFFITMPGAAIALVLVRLASVGPILPAYSWSAINLPYPLAVPKT
jgi:hypothetical protein